MMDDLRRNALCMEIHSSTGRTIFRDGSEIVCVSVTRPADLHKIRGMRFDLVVEHPDARVPYDVMNELRRIALRP